MLTEVDDSHLVNEQETLTPENLLPGQPAVVNSRGNTVKFEFLMAKHEDKERVHNKVDNYGLLSL